MFLGEGAAQNGRMAETLNAAAKEKLPLLFLVIDNGRAINTFTPDVAANSDVFAQVRFRVWDGLDFHRGAARVSPRACIRKERSLACVGALWGAEGTCVAVP